MDSSALAETVAAAVPGSGARAYELDGGVAAIEVDSASLVDVLAFLRDEAALAYRLFLDVTAVDHEADEGKLHIVYSLRSLAVGRVAVRVRIDAKEAVAPTVSGLFKGANWAEREVFDMFGVRFDGHPDLRRILMYEEFEGHPLRKSYPYDKRQPLVPERDPINDPWPKRYT